MNHPPHDGKRLMHHPDGLDLNVLDLPIHILAQLRLEGADLKHEHDEVLGIKNILSFFCLEASKALLNASLTSFFENDARENGTPSRATIKAKGVATSRDVNERLLCQLLVISASSPRRLMTTLQVLGKCNIST